MVATPAAPLGHGAYLVEWTTTRRRRRVAHADLDVHRRHRRDADPDRRPRSATAAASSTPAAADAAVHRDGTAARRPDAARAVGRRRTTAGSGSDVIIPIVIALVVIAGGPAAALPASSCARDPRPAAGRVTPRRPRHARPPDVLAARARARLSRSALGFASCCRRRSRPTSSTPTYTSRLPLAVYVVGAATTVALSFASSSSATSAPQPPDLTAEGTLPPAWLRIGAPRDRPVRLGLDHRPGHRRRRRATAMSRRSSCGSTAGSAWRSSARCRPGLAVPRPVLDAPRPRRLRSCARSHVQGWALADYPERLGRWPAVDRLRVLRLARARRRRPGRRRCSSCSSATPRCTLAMMAQFGRDEWRSHGETFTVWFRLLGRLAPLAPRRRGRAGSRRRSFGSGLLEPRLDRAPTSTLVALGVVVDHLRRAVADPAVLRPVRAPGIAVQDARCSSRSSASSCGSPSAVATHGRPRRDRRRAAADRARLPHRPLPDLPADRRAAHPHRDLRPVPEGLGPVRHRVPHADRRVAAAGPRLDRPAGGRRRRPHAGRVGRPRRRGGRRPAGHLGRRLRRAADPARGRDGRRSRR